MHTRTRTVTHSSLVPVLIIHSGHFISPQSHQDILGRPVGPCLVSSVSIIIHHLIQSAISLSFASLRIARELKKYFEILFVSNLKLTAMVLLVVYRVL